MARVLSSQGVATQPFARLWATDHFSAEVGEEELLHQMIRNQGSEFGGLHHPFTAQEQCAIRKEVGRGVGFEGVAFLDLATAARDMHLGFADFHIGKLRRDFFEDRVVGLAGLTGR